MNESTEAESVSETRREFCRKALKRTTLAAAAAAGAVLYEKPSIKSFFGTREAYAATTGPGKFSLKGDSN
ncbi:MAG: hypothetical protein JRJ85_22555 [Deltaproteobacteria bacterium]|nr:hypothetical protein [Deltaproteobacteria bacterium]